MPDGNQLRMWSNAELIMLAERMQQGLDVRDRYFPRLKPHNLFVCGLYGGKFLPYAINDAKMLADCKGMRKERNNVV